MSSPHFQPTPAPATLPANPPSAMTTPSLLQARPSSLDSRRLFFSPIFYLLATISCILLCATANATVVTLQGGFGYPNAKGPDGQPLEPGHKVSIGTFADGFDPAAHADDLPALLANWRQFHFGSTDTIDNEPGSFWLTHASPDGTNLDGFLFPGKKIYLLLTRTLDGNPEPAADASNIRDFALFTSSHSAWSFRPPASENNLPPGDRSDLNSSQINSALVGTLNSDGSFALANFSSPEDPGDGSTPSAFEQWLATTFGETSGVTADSIVGPAGLSALATYALASTPEATVPPYTTITDDTGRIGIEFTRKKDPALRTFAQASSDLVSWNLEILEAPLSETADTETLRAFPVFPENDDQSKAFFRIRVEPAN
jgi:hypothetical protein